MMCMNATTTAPSVKLNGEALTAMLPDLGHKSLTALAHAAGVSPSTLSRCARGLTAPGPTLIGALIRTTGRTFDELFVADD